MDDPHITMEDYIRLEEEKAQKHGKVFNWETAKYGKIWYDEDIHDLGSVESKFPAIAFNDRVSSKTLSCEPTVSSLNDEIDFKILFDDSGDEDYTVFFDKNLFSYKIISTNDLKTDSENDSEKIMPSLPSPKPTVSCFDDLDIFKDFENEFSAIVYNDAQTSKSDLLTEPILSPQHIDEFDLDDETSLSGYDEEKQNFLYFNDLFPFNIIHPNNLKTEKDNDDNEVDIIQSSRGMIVEAKSNTAYPLTWIRHMTPLPPRDQRHLWIRYQVKGYTEEIIHDFEQRLDTIFGRQVNRVHILDFEGLTLELRQDLAEGMRMVYTRDDGQELGGARRSMTWRQFIFAVGLHTTEEMAKDGFGAYWLGSERLIPDKGDLRGRHVEGKKSGARLSRGHFIRRLAHHFGLVSDDGLRGLSVVARELPLIDMAGASGAAEDAPAVDEGVQADPTPVQAPQQPPPPPPTAGKTMPQRLGRLNGQTFQAFDGTFWGSSPTACQRRTKKRTGEAITSTGQQDQQQPDL
ncbi:hypothetical protein Tco_1134325 [Tanacetum coccineum]